MERDNEFHLFHRYLRLSKRGFVEPLTHESCGGEFYTSLDKEDELVLICAYCDSEVTPGLKILDKVKQAVEKESDNEQT